MRVLWLATSPSLYDEGKVMGWIGSLENIVRKYCPEIELGIAFEHSDREFKVERNGVTYYPINFSATIISTLKLKYNGNNNWFLKKPLLMKILEDFKPDIIHCFGSEWNWGLLAKETKIPFILHMQGFINLYNYASSNVKIRKQSIWYNLIHPREFLQKQVLKYYNTIRNSNERKIMSSCRFFMGRTEWDKNIVRYYSPESNYYYCPEAIRPAIYDAKERWSYKKSESIRIVTIASAGRLKGNGIILETAKFLKELGVKFEWRVSGNKGIFTQFERSLGIKASDVNVTLLGYIDVNQVKQELINAEIYVLPSIIDNSPNSLCEAQLIGIPVIASYVGGVPQIVEDNKTGILYPYNEPHSLAFKILNLHKSPDLQKRLSENEIEQSHLRHNPQKLSKRLTEIYTQVIANNQKN